MYEENFCIRRIRELMEKNDFNPYRLAVKSGISLSTLNSMLRKNTEPRVETIDKICSACDISIAQFFDRSSTDLSRIRSSFWTDTVIFPRPGKDRLLSYLGYLSQND